jgi:transcription antitermination factor NusA-like protein
VKFITNALSPAKVVSVETREEGEDKVASVKVKEDQLSLAIGRGGQNVRLASKLTGWKIDIASDGGSAVLEEGNSEEPEGVEDASEEATEEVSDKNVE